MLWKKFRITRYSFYLKNYLTLSFFKSKRKCPNSFDTAIINPADLNNLMFSIIYYIKCYKHLSSNSPITVETRILFARSSKYCSNAVMNNDTWPHHFCIRRELKSRVHVSYTVCNISNFASCIIWKKLNKLFETEFAKKVLICRTLYVIS